MAPSPIPRFTSQSDFEAYLRTSGNSVPKQTVLPILLAAAETMVERYCRRRFAPSPSLSTDYQRQVVQVSAAAPGSYSPLVGGLLALSFEGHAIGPLTLPVRASELQAALEVRVNAGNVICSGGPLPTYPVSVTWAGSRTGEQEQLVADSSQLEGGYAAVLDAGFDSLPPVTRRFSTRGKSVVRVPDLRSVDASADPRVPNSGGVQLYGRRLLSNQYFLGDAAYGLGGETEALGAGEYSEPATHISLGYGTQGFSLTDTFALVLPVAGFQANDMAITGRWGWLPSPPDIVDAVYAVGARRWAERNAMFSDQMITPEGMSLAFFKQLPASVQGTLASYRVLHLDLI